DHTSFGAVGGSHAFFRETGHGQPSRSSYAGSSTRVPQGFWNCTRVSEIGRDHSRGQHISRDSERADSPDGFCAARRPNPCTQRKFSLAHFFQWNCPVHLVSGGGGPPAEPEARGTELGIMIIDCHCHAGKGDLMTAPWNTDAPLELYLRRARSAGIDKTIVFALFHSDYARANAHVAQIVARNPDRLIGFVFVHAARDSGRIFQMVQHAVKRWNFRGIKA